MLIKLQTPENLGAAYLTCCQSGKKISLTSCHPHLKCEPRFHIDDSKNQFKVSCMLVCTRKKRVTSNSNKKENEEIFTVTNFVVFNSQSNSANSKVNLLQEDSNSRNIFLMKLIIEVQWYICLKEQIHQHIVMNDVCRNLFGFEEEDSKKTTVEVRTELLRMLHSYLNIQYEFQLRKELLKAPRHSPIHRPISRHF